MTETVIRTDARITTTIRHEEMLMTEGPVTICFLHGVELGEAGEPDGWIQTVESTVALLPEPRPSERGVDYRTITYGSLFADVPASEKPIDKVRAREFDSQVRADFAVRRERIGRHLSAHLSSSPKKGWGHVPGGAAAVVAQAGTAAPPLKAQAGSYNRDALRRRDVIEHILAQMPTRGRVVLVAHSLGSVVALDVIAHMDAPADIALITIGSPLSYRDHWKHVRFSGKDFPYDRVRSWVNVFDTADPVSVSTGLGLRFPEVLDLAVSFGAFNRLIDNHAAAYYLSLPVVAAAIAEAAYDRTEDVDGREVARARQVGDSWSLLLLAHAYGAQLSRTCDPKKYRWRRRFDTARTKSAHRLIAEAEENSARLGPEIGEPPTVTDMLDQAAARLGRRWSDEQLVPYCLGLLMGSPTHPFTFDIDSDHASEALMNTLDRIRQEHPTRSDREFADALTSSLEMLSKDLGGGRRRLGPYLLVAGAAVLAITGVGVVAAAPAGLAGAALLTSTLASVGPGGMVGGMLTIALGSSVGASLMTSGAVTAGRRATVSDADARRYIDGLKNLTADQLKAACIGLLAEVRVQDVLDLPDESIQARALLGHVHAEVVNELNEHAEIQASSESAWEAKQEVLASALAWLDEHYPVALVDVVEAAIAQPKKSVTAAIEPIRRQLRASSDGDPPAALPE